jgi:enamine deaminase RidA (YjgF/YER057c/UK114 family)
MLMSTSSVYEKLNSLEITLPEAAVPVGAYVPFVQAGSLVYVSGHIAKRNGKAWVGKLGDGFDVEQGRAAARAVAVDHLGTLNVATGGLDRVRRIVKLMVLVNSSPGFTEQPQVANGASELFVEVFGERGLHPRSAIGVAQLPLGSLVEIELIAEIE